MIAEAAASVSIAAYARVSTQEQKNRQNPIATQKEVCRKTADQRFSDADHDLAFYVDEGISGTIGEEGDSEDGRFRPDYTRMLSDITSGRVEYVVVQSLDRLGRDEADVFRLRELLASNGVPVVTPTKVYDLTDPDDVLMFGVHALMAAHQPRQTSIKSCAGKLQRKRRGLVPCSRPPFGWRLQEPGEYTNPRERTVTAVPDQGEVVREISDLYLRGWGYERIARHLEEQGVPAYGPSGWYGSFVRTVLMKPVHAGLVYVEEDDEYIEGVHCPERHYEPERFHRIKREMARRADVRCYSAQGEAFLVGTLRCAHCGSAMAGQQSTTSRYYRCPGDQMDPLDTCPAPYRKAEHVEQAVLRVVKEFAASDAVQRSATEHIQTLLSADDEAVEAKAAKLQQRLDKQKEQLAWLVEEAARQPQMRETFEDSAQKRREQIEKLAQELAALEERREDAEQRTRQWEQIREILLDFDAVWDAMNIAEKRRAVALIFEELTLETVIGGSRLHLKPFFTEGEDVFIPALKRSDRPDEGVEALTPRECEVLHLRDEGLSVTEIADQFGITRDAVHQHRYSIRAKLHVERDEEAIELSRDYVDKMLPFLELEGRRKHDPEPEALGDAERRILEDLVNDDLRYKDIAERHGIKEGTVKATVSHIAEKLRSVGGRKNVVDKARKLGLLDGVEGEGDDDDDAE